jgi:hypothetical protein
MAGAGAVGPAVPTGVPHSGQKRAPAGTGSPHAGQGCWTGWPQCMQNFLPDGVAPPQDPQTIIGAALTPRLRPGSQFRTPSR